MPRPPRYALPADLGAALKHLDDAQLDALLSSVTAEARRRGRPSGVGAVAPERSGVKKSRPRRPRRRKSRPLNWAASPG